MSVNVVKKDLRTILGIVTGIIPIVAPICSIIVVIMKKRYLYTLFPIITLLCTLYTCQPNVNTPRRELKEDKKEECKDRILAMEFDTNLLDIPFYHSGMIRNILYEKIYLELTDVIDLGMHNQGGRENFRRFIDNFENAFTSDSKREEEFIYMENTFRLKPKAYASYEYYLNRACDDYIDMLYPDTIIKDLLLLLLSFVLWVGMIGYNLFVFKNLL